MNHPTNPLAACALFLLPILCMPSTSGADTPSATEFDAMFAKNIAATKVHFLGAIDCENRDEFTGMPVSTLVLPGATRSRIDSTDYAATYIFPAKGPKKADLVRFVQERAKANLPKGFEWFVSKDGTGGQITHKTARKDHFTVEINWEDDSLRIGFYPPLSVEIPWGNRCNPPKTKAQKPEKSQPKK